MSSADLSIAALVNGRRYLPRIWSSISAQVDLASGRVTQVHVEDEAVGDADEVLVIDEPDLSAADHERAIAVAAEQPWPARGFGG